MVEIIQPEETTPPANRLDLAYRPLRAVVVPHGDGFVACGIQLAAFGYGEEVDDALADFTEQCGEVKYGCAADLDTDLAFVYGIGKHVFRRLELEEFEDRSFPPDTVGHG